MNADGTVGLLQPWFRSTDKRALSRWPH